MREDERVGCAIMSQRRAVRGKKPGVDLEFGIKYVASYRNRQSEFHKIINSQANAIQRIRTFGRILLKDPLQSTLSLVPPFPSFPFSLPSSSPSSPPILSLNAFHLKSQVQSRFSHFYSSRYTRPLLMLNIDSLFPTMSYPFQGNKSFIAFSNLGDADALTKTWKVRLMSHVSPPRPTPCLLPHPPPLINHRLDTR